MADWPLAGHAAPTIETGNHLSTFSRFGSVSAGGSNAKGSYTELIAATARDTDWILVELFNPTTCQALIDIAVGAAASEQIILENLLTYREGGSPGTFLYLFPVSIPAGTRIAGRGQCSAGSAQNINCGVLLGSGGFAMQPGYGAVVTYGAVTADSGGTSIDPGGTANTEGSWVEITSATTRAHRWLVVAIGNRGNNVMSAADWTFDIGIGTGGSEVELVSNIQVRAETNENLTPPSVWLPVSVSAGERIAIRSQCSITDATDRLFDVVLYGVS